MSVQFDSIVGLHIPHLGLIWQQFNEEFPNVEQHAALAGIVERLKPTSVSPPQISLSTATETPRVWFLSEDGADLIQLQPNRFVRNWRKQPTEQREYPHYDDHIRPSFLSNFSKFRRALVDIGLEDVSINHCELTYVNHIMPNEVWDSHSQIGRILNTWSTESDDLLGPVFESASVRISNQIRDKSGSFLGRLHFDIQPSFVVQTGDPQPMFVCNLVARGQPIPDAEDGYMQFLDLGRIQMIELFEKIFTEEIRESWN